MWTFTKVLYWRLLHVLHVLYFAVLLDRCLMDINSTSQYFPFRGKKGALDSQPQVIKFTSCLPMVGGSLRVLRLPPPLNIPLRGHTEEKSNCIALINYRAETDQILATHL